MNTLYDLVTRVDALTANSQQVLNALIRSCLATGSSSGYKVKKFDQTVEMTRADIYRLYDFYNTWEQAGFPSDDRFDTLLAKADSRWHRNNQDSSGLATDAVVKHSKILYMTSANKDKAEDDYWTDKIRDSASGKAVVSTAPIPINLRTPLYDENLSVKSFSQYETYLFPLGYRRTEILGTPDNGEDYLAGGQNWEIDATDFFRVSARHITMGRVSNRSPKLENYGDSYGTFSWGDESYAFGTGSVSLGGQMLAIGDYSAALGGFRSAAYGPSAFATGSGTVAPGSASAALGSSTTAGGMSSMAANSLAVTGGYPYGFTVRTVESTTVTPGSVVCVGANSAQTIGECYLTAEAQTENANYTVLTVKVGRSEGMLPFDIAEGDTVRIYGLYGRKDGKKILPFDADGYAYPTFETTVVSVGLSGEDSSADTVYYEVRLAENIPVNYLMPIAGGYVQSIRRRVNVYGPGMTSWTPTLVNLGAGSSAFNYNTIARGPYQTVSGTSNLPDDMARFIVGTGSKDVTLRSNDPETGEPRARANGLLIAPQYGYMKLFDGSAGFSVSKADSNSAWDGGYHMYEGATVRAGADSGSHSRMQVTEGRTLIITRSSGDVARIGTAASGSSFAETGHVSAVFSSLQGTAVISSGSYIKAGETEPRGLIDTLITESRIIDGSNKDHNVAVYSADGIELRSLGTGSHGIHVWASSYLTQTFSGLKLEGNTFGALTATDTARSFTLSKKSGGTGLSNVLWGEKAGHSGFYYGNLAEGSFQMNGTEDWGNTGVHVFNSTVSDGGNTSTLTVAFPDTQDASTFGSLHPVVTSAKYNAASGSSDAPEMECTKKLAYLDDVSFASGWLLSCGYQSETADARLGVSYGTGNERKLPIASSVGSCYGVVIQARAGSPCMMHVYNNANSLLFTIKEARYILNGDKLSISFYIHTDDDHTFTNGTDFYIPVLCGCGITSIPNGNPMLRLAGDIRIADKNDNNWPPAPTVVGLVDGLALLDGLIILRLSVTHSGGLGDNKLYHCTINGVAPFIPAAESVGTNNVSAESRGAINTTVSNIVYSWTDLASGSPDGTEPTVDGLLVQAFNDIAGQMKDWSL